MTPDSRRYTIQRHQSGKVLHSQEDVPHKQAIGTITLIWGEVPDTLAEGGELNEEWKLHIGGADWVIVKRTA